MEVICKKTFSEERALYGVSNVSLIECKFEGEEDGESALKETSNINAENCEFRLRYPLWHVSNLKLKNILMTDTCRAALWYDKNVTVESSTLGGIKALRECSDVSIVNTDIVSSEFGWNTKNVKVSGGSVKSEYAFMNSGNVTFENVSFSGKYSFQYATDLVIKNSFLDTKDAFWHVKNAYVENSIVKGEYLGWYSEGLTLKYCKIIGTQPLCYCKNLKLIDCTMEGCDLAFENSDVTANILSGVDSIKTPNSGEITALSVGEIVTDKCVAKPGNCKIVIE